MMTALASTIILAGCNSANVKNSNGSDSDDAARYHTTAGMIHIQRNELVKAKRPLARALENSPNYADAHAAFAMLYVMEGELELAEKHYKKAIKSKPKNARVLNNYGTYLYGQGKYSEAVKYLKKATADPLYVNRASSFVNLGKSELKLSHHELAASHFKKAIRLDRNTFEAYINLAKIAFKDRKYIEAENLLDAFREAKGKHIPESLLLGIKVANELGNKGKAKGYEIVIKNLYLKSKEYQLMYEYKQSRRNNP